MASTRDKIGWVFIGAALVGTVAYAGKRFMEPNDPSRLEPPAVPTLGAEFIGRKFEPFKLRGVDRKPVDSSLVLGKRPAVVIFHGGRESPFSMIHVAHLGSEKEIRDTNAIVYIITIDDPNETQRSVVTEWRRQHLPQQRDDFVFLGDDYGAFSEQYVGKPSRTNPHLPGSLNRATFVVGKDRKINFAYVHATPKLQPSEKDLLAAVVRARKEIDQK